METRTYYQATDRGFEKQTETDTASNAQIGEQLAINAMKEITGYWKMMAASAPQQ